MSGALKRKFKKQKEEFKKLPMLDFFLRESADSEANMSTADNNDVERGHDDDIQLADVLEQTNRKVLTEVQSDDIIKTDRDDGSISTDN